MEDSRDLSKLLNVYKPKNLEKIENDQNYEFDYHYSERCKIGNIFDYLKINENENIKVFENSSPVKINFDEHFNAKSIFIENQKLIENQAKVSGKRTDQKANHLSNLRQFATAN